MTTTGRDSGKSQASRADGAVDTMTVSGDYTATFAAGGAVETITEVAYTGHPRKSYSYAEHRYDFTLPDGTGHTFNLLASRTANSEGDNFVFEYSTDGATWLTLATVTSSSDQTFAVPLGALSGSVTVRAVEGTEFECLQPSLSGPLILAFSQEDPGAAARVIRDFAKDEDKLKVTLVSIGGQMLAPNELETLAKLPTYDQAVSMLMSVMQAPIQKLAQTMNEVPGKLVRTVAAIRDEKEAA